MPMQSEDVDMGAAEGLGSAQTCAQTTSWEEFERTGEAHGEYTYKLDNFDDAMENPRSQGKVFSEEFEIAAYSWKLLIMPRGNDGGRGNMQGAMNISIFLQSAEAKYLPISILPHAKFKLCIVNRQNPEASIVKDTEHRFTEKEDDWGFSNFCPLGTLKDKRNEFYPDGTLHIRTTMSVELEEKYTGVTRQRTGYVGLKNQGATCYMNSLLQALFHVPQFRRAVYHMPTTEGEEAENSIPLALKHLFFRLQYSPTPVSTKELVRSFGWTTMEAFVQQDVEELELKLCEKLEEKMKGTIVDKSVDRLLKGKTYNFIKCKNVDYSSTKSEEFLDLQLDVMGINNVYESLEKICKVEELSGDNKYDAEGYGLQDATKGILFEELPPVLQLHLRRFDFDLQTWTSIKVNTRFEFYETLEFDTKHLAPTWDASVVPKYRLYAVLVHSGASQGGHYYAYIRPNAKDWYKFDDETVTQVDEAEAIAQQYGGDTVQGGGVYGRKARSLNNAYMLVYVRESDWTKVMKPTGAEEVQEHVRKQLESQLQDKDAKRRAKMQAHRFVTFKIVTLPLIAKHVASEAFHLINVEELPDENTLKMDKTLTWEDLMTKITSLTNIPRDQQMYWIFSARDMSGQQRPAKPFFPQKFAEEQLKNQHRAIIETLTPQNIRRHYIHKPATQTTLNPIVMYVHDVARGGVANALALEPHLAPTENGNPQGRNLVFLKEYRPEDRAMRMVGAAVVEKGIVVQDLVRGMLGSSDTAPVESPGNIMVWEEACADTDLKLPEVKRDFHYNDAMPTSFARHGDILVVQRVSEAATTGTAAAAAAAGQRAAADGTNATDIEEGAEMKTALSHYQSTVPGGGTGTAGFMSANQLQPGESRSPQSMLADEDDDDNMHDAAENDVTPSEDDFATACGFLRHVHSLRRLQFSPLPGGAGVRGGVPASASQASLMLQDGAPLSARGADGAESQGGGAGESRASLPSMGGLPSVTIEVHRNASYADVVIGLSNKLHEAGCAVGPEYLRLTLHNAYTSMPNRKPLESGYAFVANRCTSFSHAMPVYYEVLDMPLEELEKLKALRVKQVKANTELVRGLTVRLPPSATIAELLDKVMQQAAAGYAETKKVRAVKVYSARVFELCAEDASIDEIDTSYWQLRVEPVPPDDVAVAERCEKEGVAPVRAFFTHSQLVAETQSISDFGDPLVLLLHPDESMESAVSRIRQRLKMEEEDMKEWQWGVRAHLAAPEEIKDMSVKVADQLAEMQEHQSMKFEHPPYISMFHEQKGYAGRAPRAHEWMGREAQITLS